jgi:hypothetical protein
MRDTNQKDHLHYNGDIQNASELRKLHFRRNQCAKSHSQSEPDALVLTTGFYFLSGRFSPARSLRRKQYEKGTQSSNMLHSSP